MPYGPPDAVSLRDVAVARSVDPARVAAEERVQRFIDTALELIAETGGTEFTIQNIVDRSGQSLRSFYNHFAGKHELLLAAVEEGIRIVVRQLEEAVETVDDPLEKLHVFTLQYYRTCRTGATRDGEARGLGNFAYQLLYDHPVQSERAFRPLAELLRRLLTKAEEAGSIRLGISNDQVVAFVLQSIMFNAFSTTITGDVTDDITDRAEGLWRLLAHGLSATAP